MSIEELRRRATDALEQEAAAAATVSVNLRSSRGDAERAPIGVEQIALMAVEQAAYIRGLHKAVEAINNIFMLMTAPAAAAPSEKSNAAQESPY